MTCKFCEEDLSYVEYDWTNKEMDSFEILRVFGNCIKCNAEYVESYEYLGNEEIPVQSSSQVFSQ